MPGSTSLQGLVDPAHKYLGIALPDAPSTMAEAVSLAANLGKRPNLFAVYLDLGSTLPTRAINNAYDFGALTLISWAPATYSLRSIAAGREDGLITSFAEAVQELGLPVALDFGHEMNGDWYPWGMGVDGNTPSEYVAAYRHIHDLFQRIGVTKAIWVWHVNVTATASDKDLEPLYPGDGYVDWVGLTGYLGRGSSRTRHPTFADLFDSTFTQLRTFTDKPVLVAESGAAPGSWQPGEITSLIQGVERVPGLIGFVYFDIKGREDWRIDADSASVDAFRQAVAVPAYGFDVRNYV
jgi:hypothetical protein